MIGHTINSLFTIAFRDLTKLLRDRLRLAASLVLPLTIVGVLGASIGSSSPDAFQFNYVEFLFTGILAQVMFQSTAAGVISLVRDRENDFSRELFVAPVSRYLIIGGKILGESMVSAVQAVGVIVFGLVAGPMLGFEVSLIGIVQAIPAAVMASFLGGAFGILVLGNVSEQRTANQLFPFIIFPQFFIAGIFFPLSTVPPLLGVLARIAPMTYAVDLVRGMYYAGLESQSLVTGHSVLTNVLASIALFVVFLVVGTVLFVRKEKNQ